MKNKITLILLILVALSSILFINLGNKSTAQECNDCTPIPIEPGDSDYSKINCECSDAIPTIKASASTIAPGGSITLWVDSGGLACPDFTWSVSSAKYTLNKSKTTNDLETVTMTAASGTCSSGYNDSNIYVTVTVTDNCGITSQVIIRNTSGQWTNWTTICGGGLTDFPIYGDELGLAYRYRIAFDRRCEGPRKDWDTCAELIASGTIGFPNADGIYIRKSPPKAYSCSISENNKIVGYKDGYESYVRSDKPFYVQQATWGCP